MDTNSKKYKTILADPPWDINQRGNYGAIKHYDLMPLDRIKAMPVADLCEDNAHLYLWCPNSLIPQALETITAWGFRFRCTMVWCKPRMLLGRYIRTAHETLLMSTRGKAPVKFHAQPSWVFAPQQEHSHKPAAVLHHPAVHPGEVRQQAAVLMHLDLLVEEEQQGGQHQDHRGHPQHHALGQHAVGGQVVDFLIQRSVGGDAPLVQVVGEQLGDRAVPVNHKDLLGTGGEVVDPRQEMVPVGVGAQAFEIDNLGLNGDVLSEQPHGFCSVQKLTAQGALPLIAYKDHGAVGSPQVML